MSFIALPWAAPDPDGDDCSGVCNKPSTTVIELCKWILTVSLNGVKAAVGVECTSSLNGTIPLFSLPGIFTILGTGGGGISTSLVNIVILDPLGLAGMFEGGGIGGGGILTSSSLNTVIFDDTRPDTTRLDLPACLRVVPPAFLVSGTFSFTRVLRVPTSGYGV